MISFLNSIYLYTLIGLSIPIAIHLWNNKKSKTRKVGSIQLIIADKQSRLNSISFHDIVLFIIRTLLFICLTLLISETVFTYNSQIDQTKKWILIDPSINLKDVQHILKNDYEARWFYENFPKISEDIKTKKINNLSTLNSLKCSKL